MGAVAGAASRRRLRRASLPPLRQQRLRRQQQFGLPHHAAARARARPPSRRCSPRPAPRRRNEARHRPPAVHAVRRRRALRRARDRRRSSSAASASASTRAAGRRPRADASSPSSAIRSTSGSLWRDASFARAVRAALARDRPDVVQTHERIAGCDIFRAGDGVHRVWLDERARTGGRLERLGIATNPYHRYVLAAESRVFADPSLKAVICISQMVRDDIRAHFRVPEERLHVIYNAVDPREFGPHVRAQRDATRARLGLAATDVAFLLLGSGYARKGVPAALQALAQLPDEARLVVVGRDKNPARYAALAARLGVDRPRRLRRTAGRSAAVSRRRRRVRAADALRSAVQRRAGSARLRAAGRHQPPLRRRRARRGARRRRDLRRGRRRRRSRRRCARLLDAAERASMAARAPRRGRRADAGRDGRRADRALSVAARSL